MDRPENNRKLTAVWTLDSLDQMMVRALARKKPETEEEEAEEIIHRLKHPPVPNKSVEEVLMEELAKSIAEEIDSEILKCLKKNNHNPTSTYLDSNWPKETMLQSPTITCSKSAESKN